MPKEKTTIMITNQLVHEMTGLNDLSFVMPDHAEMNEAELLLARMMTFTSMLRYAVSGQCLDNHLRLNGLKPSYLNAQWHRQYKYIRNRAVSDYAKTARYFIAASRYILNPGDDDLLKAGDANALARFNLVSQCSYLMSALHPEADHAFFKSIIGDMPDYVRKKEQPRFTRAPELTPGEFAEVEDICAAVLPIFEKDPTRAAGDIIAQYIAKRYLEINPVEEELPSIPQLHSITPTQHIIPNNKITNALSAGHISFSEHLEDFFPVRVSKNKAKKEVISSIMVAYEGENVQITGRRPFTEYDRNVYNAVVSLYAQGDPQHVMSPAMIYRAMTGLPEASNPSPQQIGAVSRSIDKMRFTRVRIDCTEELKQRKAQLNGVPIVNGKVDTYLLNADGAQVSAGGHTIEAYRINQPPVLYEYSRAVNQVLTVPADLLAIKEVDKKGVYNSFVPNTESRIQVKGYLLRRIEGMKGKNALNSNIISLTSYDKDGKHHQGIYEIYGKPEPSTKDATIIRSFISDVLDFWIAEKYIKGYSFMKEGKKFVGVKIDIPNE